jgi:hypothetical protein
VDKDGGISYEEFVDALARETVAPAAMGKRGMQSTEAMGVDNHPTGDRPVANWHASDTTDVTDGDWLAPKGPSSTARPAAGRRQSSVQTSAAGGTATTGTAATTGRSAGDQLASAAAARACRPAPDDA